ncbi:hypothetical protein LSCM1_05718 [Leishmania martiniquensis]|uniref:EF-hand domain-containing protein n=1 Tax=Leishmania martiniquensis TaxID=1580590 RepID=A0A836GZI4_9TRYP|nr:hypothetical protein LSCM1_05718 [Leishmania martiniquensis]
MLILRIAGDVEGVRRNIEVAFPHRPSLQQLCTVAETILPLQGRGDRWPRRSPWSATTQGRGDDISTTAPSRARTESSPRIAVPAAMYVVESLVYLNRATHEWEPLYSGSQLTSGVQVYCLCPLQRLGATKPGRTAANSALPFSLSAFPAREARVHEAASPGSQEQVSLPKGTGVQQTSGYPNPPGAIPEPQQRLFWDCAAAAQDCVRQTGQDMGRGFSRIECPSPSPTRASLRSGEDATHRFAARRRPARVPPSLSNHHRRSSSLPPFCVAAFGASAWPALSPTAGAASRGMDRLSPPSSLSTPRFSARQGISGLVRTASSPPRWERRTSVEAQRRKRSPSRRQSASPRLREDCCAFLSHLSPDWLALLLSGEGGRGNLYAHLGDRLALLFDILVHLDPQEGGAGRRQYILLRDFHLLASCFTSTSAAAALLPRPSHTSVSVCGTPVPWTVMNVTAELDAQLHWTWSDVVRHADKDRDGGISYGEWVSFGVEYPEVIQLLCRAVHALLLRQEASSRGHCSDRHPSLGAQIPTVAPFGHLFSHSTTSTRDRGGRIRSSEDDATRFSGACHFSRVSPEHAIGTRAERNRMMRVAAAHGTHGKRFEASRELQGERPEDCRGSASAPANFAFTPRR